MIAHTTNVPRERCSVHYTLAVIKQLIIEYGRKERCDVEEGLQDEVKKYQYKTKKNCLVLQRVGDSNGEYDVGS